MYIEEKYVSAKSEREIYIKQDEADCYHGLYCSRTLQSHIETEFNIPRVVKLTERDRRVLSVKVVASESEKGGLASKLILLRIIMLQR